MPVAKKVIVLIGDAPISDIAIYEERLAASGHSTTRFILSDLEVSQLEKSLDDSWNDLYRRSFGRAEFTFKQGLSSRVEGTEYDILCDTLCDAVGYDIEGIAFVLTGAESGASCLYLTCMLDLFGVTTGIVTVPDRFNTRHIAGSLFFLTF